MSIWLLAALGCGGDDDVGCKDSCPDTGDDTGRTAVHSGSSSHSATGGTHSGATVAHSDSVAHTGGTTEETGLPPGLHGNPPAVRLPAPEFDHVVNRDGTPRYQSHLMDGHPTVLWFYPAAGTAG